MKLDISNINIVGHAQIAVNGLAVIAGENGTGKSTIGKILFATLKAIASMRGNTSASREKAVADLADPVFSRLFRLRLTECGRALDDCLPASRSQFISDISSLPSAAAVRQYFAPILAAVTDPAVLDTVASEIDALAACIDRPADAATDVTAALDRLLRSEFLGNISPGGATSSAVSFSDEASGMSLSYSIDRGNVSVSACEGKTSLRDATYIESPLYLHLIDILGKVSGTRFFDDGNTLASLMLPAHVADIVEKIESLRYTYDIRSSRVAGLSSSLAQIAGGEFFYDPERHAIMFRQGANDIVPLNVASGVKSLGLLQILLDNKIVTPDRPLIWDEPENHLHPSWQIRLARFFVTLASQGIPVIVSTHSPYFIQGIRHFAVKLHAEQFVDYYLTEMNGTTSLTQCVNDDLNRIFIKLAAPLNEIMDLSD
ncbi:MAG: AAA family ATPase [Muribaculaceae bacterium]|nr:AAA family ATPase [Muribaculaceae bacterium]